MIKNSQSNPSPTPLPDTKCLNALRFFAMCIIAFFWHYQHFGVYYVEDIRSVFEWSYFNGWLMVDLFFTLSGFGMYLGYASKVHNHTISFKEYIFKRILKLYPLFIFTLFLVTILEFWHKYLCGYTFVYGSFDFRHFLMNIILCQNGIFGTEQSFNGPSWCISVLFILYILFYVVVRSAQKRSTLLLLFGVLFLLGLFIIVLKIDYPFLLNDHFARGLASFSLGVLTAYIYKTNTIRKKRLIGYCCLMIILVYYCVSRFELVRINYFYLYYLMMVSPAIIFATIYITEVNRCFSTTVMQYLGSISLPLYLLHFPIQCCIRDVDLTLHLNVDYNSLFSLILYFFVSVLLCAAYQRYLSKPFDRVYLSLYSKLIKKD